jgi:transcriptional antiterminator RfaH
MVQGVENRTWMVVYTKPRNEKTVSERLSSQGVEVYSPIIETIRQWSDRKKKVKIPLFTSYVFVRVNEKDRSVILQDPGVMNFVFWLGKPAIIRDSEMDEMIAFLENHKENELTVKQLKKGDKIVFKEGPLKEIEGTFDSLKKGLPVFIIESLGIKIIASSSHYN